VSISKKVKSSVDAQQHNMTTRSTGADTSSRGPGREDRENQQHTTSFVDEGESMGQSQGGTSMSSAAKKRKGKLPRSAQNEQLVDGTTGKRRRLLLPPSCIDPDDTAEEKLHRSHNRELPVLRPISQQTLITSHTSASGAPSTVLSNTQLPSTRYFVEASEDEDDDYYFDFFGGSFNSNKGVRAAALPAISSEETESTSTRSSKYSRRKDSIQRQELDRQRAEERLEQVGERAAVRQQLSFNTAASGNTHSRSSTPSPQHNKQEISLSNATSAAARLGRYVPSSPFASHGGRSATQTASGSPAGSRPATSGKRASDLGTRTGHSSSFLGAVAVASSSRAFDFDMRIHSSSAAAGYGSSTARDQARDEELQEAAKEALAAAKSALATATKQSSTVTVQSSRPKRAAAKRAADQISSIGSAFISISSAEDEDRREYRPTEEHHVAPVDHHHSNRRSKKVRRSIDKPSHGFTLYQNTRIAALAGNDAAFQQKNDIPEEAKNVFAAMRLPSYWKKLLPARVPENTQKLQDALAAICRPFLTKATEPPQADEDDRPDFTSRVSDLRRKGRTARPPALSISADVLESRYREDAGSS